MAEFFVQIVGRSIGGGSLDSELVLGCFSDIRHGLGLNDLTKKVFNLSICFFSDRLVISSVKMGSKKMKLTMNVNKFN